MKYSVRNEEKSAVYLASSDSSSLDTEGQNLNLNLQWALLQLPLFADSCTYFYIIMLLYTSRVSNIQSDNSQNVGLEDYNCCVGIFPHFTNPSIKITLG